MQINVFSYLNAEKTFVNNQNYRKNWISIRDIGFQNTYKNMDKYCKNILILQFDDVTEFGVKKNILHPFYIQRIKKRQLIYFNESMASKIIHFANDIYFNHEILNIHCWAGKSRSQAIAYCLNQYYNLFMQNNQEDYVDNLNRFIDNFMGNSDVIKILTKELYGLNYFCI